MNKNKTTIRDALTIGLINGISVFAAISLYEMSYDVVKKIKSKFFGEPKVPDFKSDYDDYDNNDDDSGKDVDDIYEIEIPDSDFYGEDIYK